MKTQVKNYGLYCLQVNILIPLHLNYDYLPNCALQKCPCGCAFIQEQDMPTENKLNKTPAYKRNTILVQLKTSFYVNSLPLSVEYSVQWSQYYKWSVVIWYQVCKRLSTNRLPKHFALPFITGLLSVSTVYVDWSKTCRHWIF